LIIASACFIVLLLFRPKPPIYLTLTVLLIQAFKTDWYLMEGWGEGERGGGDAEGEGVRRGYIIGNECQLMIL